MIVRVSTPSPVPGVWKTAPVIRLLILRSSSTSLPTTELDGGHVLNSKSRKHASHEGNHNAKNIRELVGSFRARRMEFVERLDSVKSSDVSAEALHPRLKQPMRIIDLCFFTAEHDDQHLARITELAEWLKT